MRELLQHILDECRSNEDFKSGLAATALAGSLLMGSPSQAVASDPNHHLHKHHQQTHQYSNQDFVKALVGEDAVEGYDGMLRIAHVIRNRIRDTKNNPNSEFKFDVLKGVYGYHANRHEPKESYDSALRAWNDSLTTPDESNGALWWGNSSDVRLWKLYARRNPKFWFNHVKQVAKLGGHMFFDLAQR